MSAAEARARGVTEKLENFAAMKPRRRREAEAASIKMQAAYRGRIARKRARALREGTPRRTRRGSGCSTPSKRRLWLLGSSVWATPSTRRR